MPIVVSSTLDLISELAEQRARLGGWAIFDAIKLKQLVSYKESIEKTLLLDDNDKRYLSEFNYAVDQGKLHFPSKNGEQLLARLWPAVEKIPLDQLQNPNAAKQASVTLQDQLRNDVSFATALFNPPLPTTVVTVLVRAVVSKLINVRATEAIKNVVRQQSKSSNVSLIADLKGTDNAATKRRPSTSKNNSNKGAVGATTTAQLASESINASTGFRRSGPVSAAAVEDNNTKRRRVSASTTSC